MKVWSKY